MTLPPDSAAHATLGSFFGRYNARGDRAEQVAQGFVPSEHYWELARPGNHLLYGPRGSGKTTLLKMLLPAGLSAWTADEAERARAMVDYSSVLIPTDRPWSEQVSELGRRLGPEAAERLSLAAFTLHLLRELVDAAAARQRAGPKAHLGIELDSEAEYSIARETGEQWNLPRPVGSLKMLRTALRGELNRMYRVVEDYLGSGAEGLLVDLPGRALQLESAAMTFIELLNDAVGESAAPIAAIAVNIPFDILLVALQRGVLRQPHFLLAGSKHLPASEAFFTSADRSVMKASCCSMSFSVPSRPPGPG